MRWCILPLMILKSMECPDTRGEIVCFRFSVEGMCNHLGKLLIYSSVNTFFSIFCDFHSASRVPEAPGESESGVERGSPVGLPSDREPGPHNVLEQRGLIRVNGPGKNVQTNEDRRERHTVCRGCAEGRLRVLCVFSSQCRRLRLLQSSTAGQISRWPCSCLIDL